MFKTLISLALVGFLLGLVVTPVFAGSLDMSGSDEAEIGAALSGVETGAEKSSMGTVQSVSDRSDTACTAGRCGADPANARRVLGALLATMGTLETRPDLELGLPAASQ